MAVVMDYKTDSGGLQGCSKRLGSGGPRRACDNVGRNKRRLAALAVTGEKEKVVVASFPMAGLGFSLLKAEEGKDPEREVATGEP